MTNARDLNIEEEIRPLFDLTQNVYAAGMLKEIFSKTLGSTDLIVQRQQILKGFIANYELLKEYSFYRFNLSDIYEFLDTEVVSSVSKRKLRIRYLFSEKEREKKKGKLILMIRLFYTIEKTYLAKMDTSVFPPGYAEELTSIKKFFASFDLERYETAFVKNRFRAAYVADLVLQITEKTATGEMAAFWNRWFLFEAYLSVSIYSAAQGFSFPEFDNTRFDLKAFYHPVLKEPVKNDFTAGHSVTLLTGPNMSGKSTLLKGISICVYLAHAGLAVPASKAVIPFYESISAAINLTDSIVSGYSHFMSEIMTLKNVLTDATAGKRCFAVFDELFRGTNIEDALEISSTTIQGLNRFPGCVFIISTHLHQLKETEEIKEQKVSTLYIDCSLTGNVPAFTYKLKEGWNDLKLGRILFEKEGLNKMLMNEGVVNP
mgnify:CR=1 FL=1